MVGEEKSEERAADVGDRLLRSVSPETKLRVLVGTAKDGNRVPAELLRWNCVSVVARGESQSLTHRSGAETLKSWRTVVWTGAFLDAE